MCVGGGGGGGRKGTGEKGEGDGVRKGGVGSYWIARLSISQYYVNTQFELCQ